MNMTFNTIESEIESMFLAYEFSISSENQKKKKEQTKDIMH